MSHDNSMRIAVPFLIAALVQTTDPVKLKSVLIADAKAPIMALRADSMGRLFVGVGDGLFVYEPDDRGGYRAPQQLYRFPKSTTIQDIEIRGSDLYALTESALYRFAEGASRRNNLQPRKLLWGVPLGRPGAGFRRMAWGPEGDLYFTVGGLAPPDRWCYWTFNDAGGKGTPYRGVGGVFRCKPDGSNVRVVADGFRDAGDLTFDRFWNLFTADERRDLWHVVPQARLGKTISGVDDLKPMFTENMGPIQAGPLYYDDPLLPDKVRGRLWLVRGASLSAFAIEPSGASFKVDRDVGIANVTGQRMSIGRGGRIFSWNSKIEMLTSPDDPARHPFAGYDGATATPEKLWQELAEPSWQRRHLAHNEIVRRGGGLLDEANRRLRGVKADDPALYHHIWLAAKSGKGNVNLLGLLDHADARVRVQAIRALTAFPDQLLEEPIFAKSLLDDDPHVRLAAVSAFFEPKIPFNRAVQQAIERGPACDKDPYLRQVAALLLANKATLKQLELMCASVDPDRRMAGVRAAGYRLTLPPPTKAIAQHLPLRLGKDDLRTEIEYADGKLDLRSESRIGTFTIAEHWKADKQTEEQNLLFRLLRKMLADEDEPVRVQAAHFLALLDDPRCAEEVRRVLKK